MAEQNFSLATELQAFFEADKMRTLVDLFYPRVAQDPDLAPIFPEDFTEVREKQYCFLNQFFGGAPLYSLNYGPPNMMHIHREHPITPTRARAWLTCMDETLHEMELHPALRTFLYDRLSMVAVHFVNTEEE